MSARGTDVGACCEAAGGRADDLTCGRAALWLWRVPTAMIVAGAFWAGGRFWLWIPAFLVAGAACVVNAGRCGRVHCHVTGPIYLGSAGYSALAALGRVPFHVLWFLGTVVGLSLLALSAERVLGRYRSPAPPPGSSTAPR